MPHLHAAGRSLVALSLGLTLAFVANQGAQAQCTDPHWLPGGGCPGPNLFAACTAAWDPDGPGPAGTKIVVGGRFDVIGDAVANNIGVYDPATGTWEALGLGLGLVGDLSTVYAVVAMPDGSLIAGGDFLDADGAPASHIARWDGTSWSPLGFGMDFGAFGTAVRALAVLPDGSLVAGGDFVFAGTEFSPRIALWNGSEWVSMGTGAMSGDGYSYVSALAVDNNGDLFAGGLFEIINDVPASNIARWDGNEWTDIGGGINLGVNAIAALPEGGVLAGGNFTQAGGQTARRVAVWNGRSWSQPGGGVDIGTVSAVSPISQSEFIVGGTLEQVGGFAVNAIARLSGDTWFPMDEGLTYGGGQPIAFAILDPSSVPLGGDLIVAGSFDSAGTSNAFGLARWSDDATPALGWSALATGFNGAWLDHVAVMSNGDVLAGGDFTSAGAGVHRHLARWDGSSWGGAVPDAFDLGSWGFVEEIVEHPQGGFLIGGNFQLPDHEETLAIARWTGAAWDDLGAECNGYGRTMSFRPNGDLLLGGDFSTIGGLTTQSLALWDGQKWSAFGEGVSEFGSVLTSVTMPNGDIVIAGNFSSVAGVAANNIARWDGRTWHALGNGTDNWVHEIALAPDGTLVAAGQFLTAGDVSANSIARWDGRSWSALGAGILDGYPYSLVVEDDGDVIVGGQFTNAGGAFALNIARWDGTTWSGLGGGLAGPVDFSWAGVYGLAVGADGTLYAGGQFLRADGAISVNFARYGCEAACLGDLDLDGAVGASDLAVLLGAWGTAGDADLDGSGDVGASDLALLLGAWGPC